MHTGQEGQELTHSKGPGTKTTPRQDAATRGPEGIKKRRPVKEARKVEVSEIGMKGRRPVTNAAPDRPYMRTRARDVVFFIVRTRARDGVKIIVRARARDMLLKQVQRDQLPFISESTPQHSEQVNCP